MPQTLEGSENIALGLFRTVLASCARVQSWLGVGSAAAAMERMYVMAHPDPVKDESGVITREAMEAIYPCILYGTVDSNSASRAERNWLDSGLIWVEFHQHVPEELLNNDPEMYLRLTNDHGVMLDQLQESARHPSNPAQTGFDLRRIHRRAGDVERGSHIKAGAVGDYMVIKSECEYGGPE